MATKQYKCLNFASCNKALEREVIEIEDGEEPICPECQSKLEPVQKPGKSIPAWVWAVVALAVIGGGLSFLLLSKSTPKPKPVIVSPSPLRPSQPPAPACDDRQLGIYLRDRFASDEDLKGDSVQVDVANKTVVLSGTVGSDSERSHAEDVVHYSGCQVASVVNQLTAAPSDDSVAATIRKRYASDPELRDQPINVAVSNGVVVLSGSVASHAMKTNAGPRIARVAGVRNVINNLEVTSASVPPLPLPQPVPPPVDPMRPARSSSTSNLTGSWTGTYKSCAQGETPIEAQIRETAPDDITVSFELDVPGAAPGTFTTQALLNALNGYLALQFRGWEHQPVGLAMGNIGGYVTFTKEGAASFSGIIKTPGCGQLNLRKR